MSEQVNNHSLKTVYLNFTAPKLSTSSFGRKILLCAVFGEARGRDDSRSQKAATTLAQFLENTPYMSSLLKNFLSYSDGKDLLNTCIFGQGEQTLLLRLCQSEAGLKLLQENSDRITPEGVNALIGEQGSVISLLQASVYGRKFLSSEQFTILEKMKTSPSNLPSLPKIMSITSIDDLGISLDFLFAYCPITYGFVKKKETAKEIGINFFARNPIFLQKFMQIIKNMHSMTVQ